MSTSLDDLRKNRPPYKDLLFADPFELMILYAVVQAGKTAVEEMLERTGLPPSQEITETLDFDKSLIADIERAMRQRGIPIPSETSVQSLGLTDEDCETCPFASLCDDPRNTARSGQYEVQHRTPAQGWVNTWTDDDGQPVTFPTSEQAGKELTLYLQENPDYSPREFRVMPVQKK